MVNFKISSEDQRHYYVFRAQLKFLVFAGICSHSILFQVLDDNLDICLFFFFNQLFQLQTTFFQITNYLGPLRDPFVDTYLVKEFCRRTSHWILANTVGFSLLVSLTDVSSFTLEVYARI